MGECEDLFGFEIRDLGLFGVKISWEDVFKNKIVAGTFKGVDKNYIPAFSE